MSNPKGMVVKVLLAYGPDCDWSMAWLAGSRLAVSSVRKVWCDAKADRCKQLLLPVAPTAALEEPGKCIVFVIS